MMTHSHRCLAFGLRSPDTISSRFLCCWFVYFWLYLGFHTYWVSYIWRLHCDDMCYHNTKNRITRITLFQGAIKLKCSSSLLTIYWQSSMVSDNITHYQICSLQYLHFHNSEKKLAQRHHPLSNIIIINYRHNPNSLHIVQSPVLNCETLWCTGLT